MPEYTVRKKYKDRYNRLQMCSHPSPTNDPSPLFVHRQRKVIQLIMKLVSCLTQTQFRVRTVFSPRNVRIVFEDFLRTLIREIETKTRVDHMNKKSTLTSSMASSRVYTVSQFKRQVWVLTTEVLGCEGYPCLSTNCLPSDVVTWALTYKYEVKKKRPARLELKGKDTTAYNH